MGWFDDTAMTVATIGSAALALWGLVAHRISSQEAREETRIEGVRTELGGRIDAMTTRMDGFNARLDGLNARLDTVISMLSTRGGEGSG